jgi:hypothetical protein
MQRKAVFGAVLGAVLLAGCQTMGATGPGVASAENPDCPRTAVSPIIPQDWCLPNGVACGISVQVIADGAGGCMVVVGTDRLRMRPNPPGFNGRTEIFWWLAGSNAWEFRAEPASAPFSAPVIFKTTGASGQFTPSVVRPGGVIVHLHNANTDRTSYQYKIRVFKKGTNTSIESPDPAIVNDN